MTIERVEIENLRGIRSGKVDGLSPLSIVVGPNNSGKSTVLEALWCVGAGAKPTSVFGTLLRRGGPALHALSHVIFHGEEQAQIRAFGPGGQSARVVLGLRSVRQVDRLREAISEGLTEPIKVPRAESKFSWAGTQGTGAAVTHVDHSGRFANNFVEQGSTAQPWTGAFVDVEAVRGLNALEDAYSTLETHRRVGDVVKSLKRAMPTLTDLRILKADDSFVLHAICGDERPVPAYLAGDGFKRFLEIAACAHGAGPNGVVLLEEPESFQHPRYLGELATVLRDAAARGVQVILSTHSTELIDLLLGDPADTDASFPTVHRLRLQEGVLHAAVVSAEGARNARQELEQDLRA